MGDTRIKPGSKAESLRAELLALLDAVRAEESVRRRRIGAVLPKHRASARNLAHYLGLRKQELRRLQLDLAALGLTSLGDCEGHVEDTLLRLCAWLSGNGHLDGDSAGRWVDSAQARLLLHANSRALFGHRPSDRHVYIMVTAPDASEATADWADDVLRAGADVLRINGAHESPREWAAIVSTFRERAAAFGRSGRVIVDLPGPKLRADIRQFDDGVLRLPRFKDRLGRTVVATSVLLVADHHGGPQIPVPAPWLSQMQAGDIVELTDAAGRPRRLVVGGRTDDGVLAECNRSLYVIAGLPLAWRRGTRVMGSGEVGRLPKQPRDILLRRGDRLLINESGECADPSLPVLAFESAYLLEQVRAGERVLLDDGRILALAERSGADGLLCRVELTMKAEARLRSGKGIAFPGSRLSLRHLPQQDEVALQFALAHADAVGVSFVTTARDVALVGRRIRQSGRTGFGMILKFETYNAMRNLPAILFEMLKYDPVGIMIARGDLAVEMSFERLAEIQEELLWFGEACHVPVIWATQVLDNMAHTGLATRAEITDAAMSMRAECVMLNKGPHIAAAVSMLADIVRKMEAHQYKKRPLFRRLAIARSGD